MAEWYCMQNGEQMGPMSAAELKQRAARGILLHGDFVWRDGMAELIEAAKVNGLFPTAPLTATSPVAAAAAAEGIAKRAPVQHAAHASHPQQIIDAQPVSRTQPVHEHGSAPALHPQSVEDAGSIGYYSPNGELPARAMKHLAKVPRPTGSKSDWPLDDIRLQAFIDAGKPRRLLTGLALWFRICGLVQAVVGIVMFVLLVMLGGAGRRGPTSMYLLGFYSILGVVAALFILCSNAIRNCQVWGVVVMLCLHALALVAQVTLAVVNDNPLFDTPLDTMSFIVGLLMPAIIVALCIQALGAVRKFLSSPAWVQEAVIAAKY